MKKEEEELIDIELEIDRLTQSLFLIKKRGNLDKLKELGKRRDELSARIERLRKQDNLHT